MIARHPITGKPIRIMKTMGQVHKNNKTLIWLRVSPSLYTSPERYERWDTLVTDYKKAMEWKESLGAFPSAIIVRETTSDVLTWLQNDAPKTKHLLFLSKALMKEYTVERIERDGFSNIVCLEEMSELYPHIYDVYKSTQDDATTVLMIAIIMRVKRVFGFTDIERVEPSTFKGYATKIQEHYNIQLEGQGAPEPLWLIQQYYLSKNAKRQQEINKCLEENLKSKYVDKILLLNEEDYTEKLPTHPKIEQRIIGHRLTYKDVISTIHSDVPNGHFVSFLNSDIYVTDTFRELWKVRMNDVFLSILRYEEPTKKGEEAQLFGPRNDSQDTWILLSDSVKERTWDYTSLDFEFGKSGCDNAINVEILRKKFIVVNPALTIKTMHCHASDYRTYARKDVVDKPIFLYLDPCGIHDLEPKTDISKHKKDWGFSAPFTRKVHCTDEKQGATFCKMVTKKGHIMLEYGSSNTFVPQQDEEAYEFKDAFTLPSGLVYGYDSIFMGNRQEMRECWANAVISNMTPSLGIKSTLAVPLTEEIASDPFAYMQYYLSRILRMRVHGYNGDMWLPRNAQKIHEFLQHFRWNESVLPVVPMDNDIVTFSENVTMLTPRKTNLVWREDIEALRYHFKEYISSSPVDKKVVILQDDVFLSGDDAIFIEAALEELGYDVRIIYPSRSSTRSILQSILGASICITPPKYEALFWLLPRGCRVIELINELDVYGEGAHTSGAAGLEYWVILLARLRGDVRRNEILRRIIETIRVSETQTQTQQQSTQSSKKEPQLPLIVMPTGITGAHSHSGDTFREMVRIWEERGYVRVEESRDTPYVWLGGIGETLLYDRPTPMWIQESPAVYKKLLSGNPKVADIPGAQPWSFWPRRPMLIEERVKKPLPTYNERPDTLVFYGKIENKVQHDKRNTHLVEACDEYSIVQGVDAKYKYTQEEYIERLAQSKFGLCLGGFGPKCNREIECFALGTVPVVSPDVDMNGYVNPPVENVHYIQLKGYDPDEAKDIISKITETRWNEMSAACIAWWKENASAEGMWNLTKRHL